MAVSITAELEENYLAAITSIAARACRPGGELAAMNRIARFPDLGAALHTATDRSVYPRQLLARAAYDVLTGLEEIPEALFRKMSIAQATSIDV